MKRQWPADELVEHWTLRPNDWALLVNKAAATRLGCALLLKYFQYEGRFPQDKGDLPTAVIVYVAQQLGVPPELYAQYDWTGRTIEFHRAQIRQALGFREASVQDADELVAWLEQEVVPHEQRPERVLAAVYARCRTRRLEPPTPSRLDRLIRSALRQYEDRLYHAVLERLGPVGMAQLDALLAPSESPDPWADSTPAGDAEVTPSGPPGERAQQALGHPTLQDLKADPGRLSLGNLFAQIDTLRRVRQVDLPDDLFAGVSPKLVQLYRQRAAAESPSALRAHPDAVRATLVAALCLLRRREIIDGVIDLLIALVHKIGAVAVRKVERELLDDLKRVTGKTHLLYQLAEAAVDHPDGVIREVLYPLIGEQTLRDLVREYKSSGPAYRSHVQTRLRASYQSHYRRVLPDLVDVLDFRSNNAAHRPLIQALALLKRYATSKQHLFPTTEAVPLEGVVPPGWLEAVVRTDGKGRQRIDRINYELCVLQTLRDKLRCKEVWVVGADRYRNPDEDLPTDFDVERISYYEALHLPLDPTVFIGQLHDELGAALAALDQEVLTNVGVQILTKANGWIKVSPLDPLTEPPTLGLLKGEIGRRWPMTSLLDILKEADLRVGFTRAFTSVAAREALDPATLQRRLLLCLYGLGTNTGLKRIAAGEHEEGYAELRYVRRRFITREHVRAAIAQVVNAILRTRLPTIWGEGTTACASDSKKVGAWDQNLRTEWSIRHRGPGIMIYWHLRHEAVYVAVETGHARAQPGVLPLDPTRTCRRSNLAV